MLPLRVWVNIGALGIKRYSAFYKAPELLEPHHQIINCHILDTHWGGVLPLCREADSEVYSSCRLGKLVVDGLDIYP